MTKIVGGITVPEAHDPASIHEIAEQIARDVGNTYRATVNPKAAAFGAVGDGATADGTALRAAVAALTSGDRFYLPPGDFLFSGGELLIPNGVEVVADPESRIIVNGALSNNRVFRVAGSTSTLTPLDADAGAGDWSISLPSGGGSIFAVGDVIAIQSEAAWFSSGTKNRELHRVIAVDGDTVYLDGPLVRDYLVDDTARYARIVPATGRLLLPRIEATAPTTHKGYGLRIDYGLDITVDGFHAHEAGGGISVTDTIGLRVNAPTFDGLPNLADSYGYGIALNGACADVIVDSPMGRHCRHVFTTLPYLGYGGPRHWKVNHGIGHLGEGSSSVWDTHVESYDGEFNHCHALGADGDTGQGYGFHIRGKVTRINHGVSRFARRGVSMDVAAEDLTVHGGEFSHADTGIGLGGVDATLRGVHCHDNISNGISAAGTGMRIFDPTIERSGAAIQGSESGTGLYVQGGYLPYDAALQGYSVLNLPADGIVIGVRTPGYPSGLPAGSGINGTAGQRRQILTDTGPNSYPTLGRRVITPGAFEAAHGAPTGPSKGTIGGTGFLWSSVAYADTGFESAVAVVDIPPDWTTCNVYLWWTNPSAGGGNVAWRCDHRQVADGDSLNTDTQGTTVIAAAPTQYGTDKLLVISNLAVTPGKLLRLEAARNGGHASDDLSGDAHLLGVVLEQVI
ncbi:glycosyl hydrolase family 28-related protein [Euzebya sp.]|uniref:glycosyl hydrolase family 28-related protein n=1 Tax=Euzebya sp. TaxID=1971409 RepID=UPI003512A9C0